jgi:hypothetical protein
VRALLAGIAGLALAGAAIADAGHPGGVTLVVTPRALTLDLSEPARAPIAWELYNATGHALTIHGFASPRAERVTLMRRRKLLWLESWQPVDFLRLEGGETLKLEAKDYALAFDGVQDTAMTLVLITIDLGPDGEMTLGLVEQAPVFPSAARDLEPN